MIVFTIIKRLVVLPCIFGILLVTYTTHVFRRTFLFLRYGGELNTYNKGQRATIESIYDELKKQKSKNFK